MKTIFMASSLQDFSQVSAAVYPSDYIPISSRTLQVATYCKYPFFKKVLLSLRNII